MDTSTARCTQCSGPTGAFGESGAGRSVWASTAGGLDGSRVATGVAVGSRDRVYVADFPNDRILVVSADGTSLGIFGDAGAVPARLVLVFSLWVWRLPF